MKGFPCFSFSSSPNFRRLVLSTLNNRTHFVFDSRYLHSFRPPERKSPASKQRSKNSPNQKQRATEDPPQTYMRDRISDIYRILKYSTWDSAQGQLSSLPIKWDSFTVAQVLKTHPPMQKAWLFFNWVAQVKGFKHDQFTFTTMLDIFGEAGRVSSMQHVFRLMREKGLKVDTVTYTCLMQWVSRWQGADEAARVWEEMKGRGCRPTVVSYTAYLKILFEHGRVEEASAVFREMIESGCAPNCHTYTVLMEYLVGCSKYKEALDIFEKMQDAGFPPDKATCNILVEKCCKARETQTMLKILQYMKENRLVLRHPVFLEALETLRNEGQSDDLLRQVNPQFSDEFNVGQEDSDVSCTTDRAVLLILLKKQSLVPLDFLLIAIGNENIRLDGTIVSIIIEVNCSRDRLEGALLAFQYAIKLGLILDKSAYLALSGSLIRRDEFEKAVDVFKEMNWVGHFPGPYLAALLIYRLGNARRPTLAAMVFSLLPNNLIDVATYTSLMSVYFNVGAPEKAMKLYEEMRGKGIHPSLGTYDLLVAGLEKSGKVSEAGTYRKEKKRWLFGNVSESSISLEERICDLLFARDAAVSLVGAS
ncbi:pentatricopeptide repeat-containing protein At2g01390 [Punica granatum]|uniref:Uncharacterized protein n=2 Tax=Punica granatum TaxID=22663 RepID=A0A218W1J6_PUNGR|nr:pentatricopeptide repeat-containing protein At2g01390 [Punica granatum]OWM66338.1 hypothetical protein CDL15_Pgr013555 [Punica granatum]PKI41594.1 hypothetical protein CRG98_037994 [Punica granatum]